MANTTPMLSRSRLSSQMRRAASFAAAAAAAAPVTKLLYFQPVYGEALCGLVTVIFLSSPGPSPLSLPLCHKRSSVAEGRSHDGVTQTSVLLKAGRNERPACCSEKIECRL